MFLIQFVKTLSLVAAPSEPRPHPINPAKMGGNSSVDSRKACFSTAIPPRDNSHKVESSLIFHN